MARKILLLLSICIGLGIFCPLWGQEPRDTIIQAEDGTYYLKAHFKLMPQYALFSALEMFDYEGTNPYWAIVPEELSGKKASIINPSNGKQLALNLVFYPEVANYLREKRIIINDSTEHFLKDEEGEYAYDAFYEIQVVLPIDSLQKTITLEDSANKFRDYEQLSNLYAPYDAGKAAAYQDTIIALSQALKDLDREAQAWLRKGEIRNARVEREQVRLSLAKEYPSKQTILYWAFKSSGHAQEDIIRWNRLGGYFPSFDRRYFSRNIYVYPNPEAFSDVEYLEYLEIRRSQNDTDKIAWGLKKLGDLYRLKTGYAQAEKYYLDLLQVREAFGDIEKLTWVWGYLAAFYEEQGKYDVCEDYLQKIYALRDSTQDLERLVWALGGLRNLRLAEGKVEEALSYQDQIFEYFEKKPDDYVDMPIILGVILNDYAITFPDRLSDIRSLLEQWYGLPKYQESNPLIAEYIIKISNDLEDYKTAGDYTYREASSLRVLEEKITSLNNAAFYYQKAKANKQALKIYKEALALARQKPNTLLEAIQFNKIGYFYEVQKNYKKADTWYKKNLKTLEAFPDNYFYNVVYQSQLRRILSYWQEINPNARWGKDLAREAQRSTTDKDFKQELEEIIKE